MFVDAFKTSRCRNCNPDPGTTEGKLGPHIFCGGVDKNLLGLTECAMQLLIVLVEINIRKSAGKDAIGTLETLRIAPFILQFVL